jgi:hypothetical protein
MTQKEKIGLGVLVGLFIALGLALFVTVKRPSNSGGSFENNVIIDQRVRNLNKN